MILTANTNPVDLLRWLGPQASITHAFRCRENLIEAKWDGFDLLDIPKDVFLEAAFRHPDKKPIN